MCMVVFMQRFNVSCCQKTVSETECYISTMIERPTYLSTFNVGAKNHSFSILLNLDKYNIMIVMQKLKCMQEFSSAINVGCLHSS